MNADMNADHAAALEWATNGYHTHKVDNCSECNLAAAYLELTEQLNIQDDANGILTRNNAELIAQLADHIKGDQIAREQIDTAWKASYEDERKANDLIAQERDAFENGMKRERKAHDATEHRLEQTVANLNHEKLEREEAEQPEMRHMVDRFLKWKLPASVCADLCATDHGKTDRYGTNLLNAPETEDMLHYVLRGRVFAYGMLKMENDNNKKRATTAEAALDARATLDAQRESVIADLQAEVCASRIRALSPDRTEVANDPNACHNTECRQTGNCCDPLGCSYRHRL